MEPSARIEPKALTRSPKPANMIAALNRLLCTIRERVLYPPKLCPMTPTLSGSAIPSSTALSIPGKTSFAKSTIGAPVSGASGIRVTQMPYRDCLLVSRHATVGRHEASLVERTRTSACTTARADAPLGHLASRTSNEWYVFHFPTWFHRMSVGSLFFVESRSSISGSGAASGTGLGSIASAWSRWEKKHAVNMRPSTPHK